MKKFVNTIVLSVFITYLCIFFLWLVTSLFNQRFSDSVLSTLTQGDNLLWWPIVTAMFYVIYLLAAVISTILITQIAPKVESKVSKYIARLALPLSIISAMIITLTPEQFDIVSTLISFLVIIRYFVPNNGQEIINELRAEFLKRYKKPDNNDKDS